jgi:hypothetical protein
VGPVKDSPATVEIDTDAGTCTFGDGCAARYEKGLNVTPFNVAREPICIDGGKKGAVFFSKRYRPASWMV